MAKIDPNNLRNHDGFEEIEHLRTRIARLEKALVWAMRNRVMLGFRAYADVRAIGWVDGVLNWDGTDESLIETLCWLAEGE